MKVRTKQFAIALVIALLITTAAYEGVLLFMPPSSIPKMPFSVSDPVNTLNKGGLGVLAADDYANWHIVLGTQYNSYFCVSRTASVGSGGWTLMTSVWYDMRNTTKATQITNTQFDFSYYQASDLYGMACRDVITLKYNDSSTATVEDYTFYIFSSGVHWGYWQFTSNIPVNTHKFCQSLDIQLYIKKQSGPADTMACYCDVVHYKIQGFRPYLANFTVSKDIVHVQTENLYIDCLAQNATAAPITNITYLSTGGQQQFAMIFWYNNLWECIETLPYIGYYLVQILCENEWGTWNLGFLIVLASLNTFPANSYLSLFNNLSGFPLPSKNFKIFLGQPDAYDCINFRSYWGTWAVLNHNNAVNASLITNGTLNTANLVDNYIQISAYRNGLKSPFEGGMVYNTTHYATLEIQIKVLNPTWVVLIYNPLLWEKDFYLHFTQSMVGYWYDIEIPFFNFTTYANILHNAFYELGIWIENATVLVSNIRVTTHYSWNGTGYAADPYRLCSLANRQNPDNLVFNTQLETICIEDFFDNTLLYADVNYTPYLDLGLPITTMTFYNWENFSILIRIYRGLGTYLEVAVPPQSSISEEVFDTHYRLWVANQHLQQLQISYVSPNHTANYIFEVGTKQNVTVGQDFWTELWAFLLYTPMGNFLIFLLCAYLAVRVYGAVRPRGKQIPDNITKPKVKTVKKPKPKLRKNQKSNMEVNIG